MMYGKIFSSMFKGSMVGAGAPVFALMSYVIADMKWDFKEGFYVELNAKLLAAVIGESEQTIQRAIEFLCSPDPLTTTPGDGGRRLVKEGTFLYRVVNGAHYAALKTEEQRRDQNRDRQKRHREKLKIQGDKPKPKKKDFSGEYAAGEKEALRAFEEGGEEAYDSAVTRNLPEELQ